MIFSIILAEQKYFYPRPIASPFNAFENNNLHLLFTKATYPLLILQYASNVNYIYEMFALILEPTSVGYHLKTQIVAQYLIIMDVNYCQRGGDCTPYL